jgi:hypothetical protein
MDPFLRVRWPGFPLGVGMKALLHPDLFTWVKLYVVEIAATVVFVVYVVVEASKAIRNLLRK